jgi:hypothetical protein
MSEGLSKLLNGELPRATLEMRRGADVSEKEYLQGVRDKISSLGYNVKGILQDMGDKKVYHISIEREDIR